MGFRRDWSFFTYQDSKKKTVYNIASSISSGSDVWEVTEKVHQHDFCYWLCWVGKIRKGVERPKEGDHATTVYDTNGGGIQILAKLSKVPSGEQESGNLFSIAI